MVIWTVYYGGISGSESFPRNGDMLLINADTPQNALKVAKRKDDYVPGGRLRYYKEFNAWGKSNQDDIDYVIIAKGKIHRLKMVEKTRAYWSGEESEDSMGGVF